MDEVGALWRLSLEAHLLNPDRVAAIDAYVDEFFARNADLERTPRTERFIAGLALDLHLRTKTQKQQQAA